LKRLYKIIINKKNAGELKFNFFNPDYDPFKPPIIKTYVFEQINIHELIMVLIKKCGSMGIKEPIIEELV